MDVTARERAARSLRRCAPGLTGAALEELGRGLDHVAFAAGDLVLRVGDPEDLVREARLLELLGPRVSLPLPGPRFVDDVDGVLAHAMLAGRSLLGRVPPLGAARRLGRFLRELHAIEIGALDDAAPAELAEPREWLDDLDGPQHLLRVLATTVPPSTEHRVLCHADLGAEHILERDGAITGVIDWSDAAVTDPALDFARLLRDFGPEFLAQAVDAYGGVDAATTTRVTYFARCAAVEDLGYGEATGRDDYTAAAIRSLAWLFP